ncbi:MAG: transcription repressor NadR [Tuberibacillus sp.]
MQDGDKVLGDKRRLLILTWLKTEKEPLTGQALAKRTHVSRQVIVQDISLLKASGEPIMATSRGYIYLNDKKEEKQQRIIPVQHRQEETAKELYTMVDFGVTVKDVIVEHPLYGELTGSLMLKNRRDVDLFLKKMEQKKATLLADLTEGVHLHTLEADTAEQLDEVTEALRKLHILLED